MKRIDGLLARHRLATFLVGVGLMFGVLALSAHEALPEHHENTQDVICIAALAIAVLAVGSWKPHRFAVEAKDRSQVAPSAKPRLAVVRLARTPSAAARAGPSVSVVSRR